jgi:hypothetical protein
MADLLRPDDTRDALRKLGALLFGIGILMLVMRKDNDLDDGWVLILYAIPAALLYGGGIFTTDATGGTRPWQAVWSVFGLLFILLTLLQLVSVIDDTPDGALNTAWTFAVVAGAAFYAGVVKGIRFHLLAGSIALIVAWSAIWDKILGDDGLGGHIGTYRGLLGILAIILLAGAVYLWRSAPDSRVSGTGVEDGGDHHLWRASELITGAGIAAVIATSVLGLDVGAGIQSAFSGISGDEQQFFHTSVLWDTLLLLISLGLIGIGSTIGTRGPTYVGAIGLTFFLVIVGLDLNEGKDADPNSLGGWPIILLVIGGLAILVSGVKEASQGDKPKQLVQKLKKG